MKEYIFKVLIEGKSEYVKTFANSIEFAIDNIVLIEGIENIFEIQDAQTNNIWNFTGDFQSLRELRKHIPYDIEGMLRDKNKHTLH